jgi:integrase
LVEIGPELTFGPPKTKTGARTISLDMTTVAVLRGHKARQAAEQLSLGPLWTETALVFTREDGTPVRPNHATTHFPLMIKKAGLPKIRLHDLRHTSASWGLEAGESMKEVSDRLGHSSIVITADTYAHITPELAARSAERLADLVAAPPPALDGR